MTRLPLSVIGGYLGAGKTTLINRLLHADHGLRLAVLVNDFGSINIDAALLQSASEDTIELTNGCICCTMSGDLFFAVGDLLDRTPRPDHILVEASGISDPARIANVAVAEPDLEYSGILTVADGVNLDDQLADPRIAEQIKQQLCCADLVVISKANRPEATIEARLTNLGVSQCVYADALPMIAATAFGRVSPRPVTGNPAHPGYVHWAEDAPAPLTKSDIELRLSQMPANLLRLKALLPNVSEGFWEVHAVGKRSEIKPKAFVATTGIVAIGLEGKLSPQQICRWWHTAETRSSS